MGKVAIIIPTYKRNEMLGRAIDSVLNQTYKNIEIIVVDDNDANSEYRINNEALMKQYSRYPNIIYLKHEKNMNGACARNTGIRYTDADFIGFLDDDDTFEKTKIEKQVLKLSNSHSNIGAIYCGFQLFRGDKKLKKVIPNKQGNLMKDLLLMYWGTGSGSNVLFKSNVFDEIGYFDESLIRHQDWDILIRMFQKYEIIFVDDICLNIYKDSRLNIPNPTKFVEIKEYYLNKYKNEIEKFDDEIQKNIYKNHLLEICISFLKNKEIKESRRYIKKVKEIMPLTPKDKLNIFLVVIYIYMPFKEQLLIWLGPIIEKIRLIKD